MGAVAPFIGPGISLLGSLFGGISGANQQSQLGSAASGILNTTTGAAGQLLNTFLPALQGILPQLTGNMNSMQAPISGILQQLSNWNPLTQGQIGNVQGIVNNQGASMVNTFKNNVGGIANPGLEAQALGGQASGNALQAASNLGVNAQNQKLGATQAAGQLASTTQGQNYNLLDSVLGIGGNLTGGAINSLNGVAGSLMGAAGNMGNPLGSAAGGIGSLFSPGGGLYGLLGGGAPGTSNPFQGSGSGVNFGNTGGFGVGGG